ncbi:MAG: DUF4432 family protein [Terriglobia bacterium]|jgi:hypothetical protein
MPVYDNFYHHNRNYGCRCHEVLYNGFRALVLENELLRTTILVDKGTDIIELLYKPKDVDFMWRSPVEVEAFNKNAVTRALESGSFLDQYEGGWQELLPSISAPTNYKGTNLGFHGEVLFLPWQYQILEDSPEKVSVRFSVRLRRAPLLVTKIMTITSQSCHILFEETVKNEGDETFSMMWGHHPAFGKPFLSEACLIDLPAGATGLTYQTDFSGNSPFECNLEFVWPMAPDKQGKLVDLSRPMPPERKTAFNVYIKDLREGWYAVTNPTLELGIGMKWELRVFPYLLMWNVYRGFYNSPFFGRTYNLALEPYSAIPDNFDQVVRLGRDIRLQPLEEYSTKFAVIVYTANGRVKGFDEEFGILRGSC